MSTLARVMASLLMPTLVAGVLVACGSGTPPTITPTAAIGKAVAGHAAPPASVAAPADEVARATLPTPAIKVAAIWSTAGAPQPLDRPIAVALGPTSRLYVLDAGPARIHVFDRDGRLLVTWGGAGGDTAQFRFRRQIECRYASPESCAYDEGGGVAVDGQGRVYVADFGNHRVQVFSPEGRLVTVWGREGGGPGEFRLPQGIAVDSRGQIYVSDRDNHRIQKFDATGRFLAQWGGQGDGEGQFVQPGALAIDRQGRVLVVETWHPRLQAFTDTGQFLWAMTLTGPAGARGPTGVAVDDQGRVYVAGLIARVQQLTPPGREEALWGGAGAWDVPLVRPAGLAVNDAGELYVVDAGAGRLVWLRPLVSVTR
jgi:sugar lactone lactonase YvrE